VNPANIEYSIKCDTSDISPESAYTGSNTRFCRTPATSSTTQTVTCAVRDKTNAGVIFPGSAVGACSVTKTTSGGGGGGTSILYVPKCVNGFAACATTGNYSDTATCKINE
jgi:hypothetical protein